jgi:hypothetical protein
MESVPLGTALSYSDMDSRNYSDGFAISSNRFDEVSERWGRDLALVTSCLVIVLSLPGRAALMFDPLATATASSTYVVISPTSIRASVSVKTTPDKFAQTVLVPLPFVSKPGSCRAQNAIVGFCEIPDGSAAIAIVPAGRSKFAFDCDVRIESGKSASVRVVQGADTFVLIVPASPPCDFIKESPEHMVVVDDFGPVSARLPSGFTIPGDTSDVLLKEDAEIPLKQNARAGTYELHFRAPASPLIQGIDSVLQSLVVFVFALLITIASPGVIPATYYFRIVNTVAVMLLLFLAIRWFMLTRAAKPLLPWMTDSVLAIFYFAAAYGIPLWRKRSDSRAKADVTTTSHSSSG